MGVFEAGRVSAETRTETNGTSRELRALVPVGGQGTDLDRGTQALGDPITDAARRSSVERGFLQPPGVAPEVLVLRARRAINHSLGTGFERSGVARMNARSFCEELVADPRLLRLATNRPVWSCVRSLLGDRRVERPRECQIALRFPRPEGTPRTLDAPHVDGYHTPDNGLPDDGIVYNFTLLLGVFLSDVDAPLSGNFTVWPGTHLRRTSSSRCWPSIVRGDTGKRCGSTGSLRGRRSTDSKVVRTIRLPLFAYERGPYGEREGSTPGGAQDPLSGRGRTRRRRAILKRVETKRPG